MQSNYEILTEKHKLDIKKIWVLLKDCFWSKDIPIEYIAKFIEHSLCFAIYKTDDNKLVGFARVISDYTTYAYLCDVIIDHEHRRKGLAGRLVKTILSHPDLQGLKTWSLKTTEEARHIYEENGFKAISSPQSLLEIDNLEIYTQQYMAIGLE